MRDKTLYRISVLAGKSLVTASLILIFLFLIYRDYQKVKGPLKERSLMSYLFAERNKVKSKAMAITINQYRPVLERWSNFIYLREVPPEKFLQENVKYYEQILEYVPQLSDAYHMLGLCYYYLGNTERSLSYYRKSIEVNPAFVWSQHNLGLVLFRQGRYLQVIELLKNAVALKSEPTLRFVSSSRLFAEIMTSVPGLTPANFTQLKEGYKDIYALLVLSSYQGKDFSQVFYYAQKAIAAGFDQEGFFYYYAGRAMFELKQYQPSIKYFEECLKKNPDYAQAFYYSGQAYHALGQEELAVRNLGQAEVLHRLKGDTPFKEEQMELRIF